MSFERDNSSTLPVCIVGAGPMGLIASRALRKAGVPYVVIERHSGVGGLWDIDNPGTPMYESCHYISSRDGSRYYDFPMPADYPDYPSRPQILAYIRSFAERFDLLDSIEFNTAVEHAEPVGDNWQVKTSDGRVRMFSGLVVCPGSNWHPRMPHFEGQFDGRIMHAVEFRNAVPFEGKRVLIVGLGNSGADIACDAARRAEHVFVSMRRGYHFVPKHIFGLPTLDYLSHPELRPSSAEGVELSTAIAAIVGDPSRLGFPKPDHGMLETHPLLNTQILYYSAHGRITPKPNISRLAGKEVHFDDGSLEKIDIIVCATGYNYRVPFVDEQAVGWEDGHPNLFLTCFSRQHPTFFALGLLEAGGAPWGLMDQIALIIGEYLKDREEGKDRAQKMRELVKTGTVNLKEGMNYVESDRTKNYVNIPALDSNVNNIIEEFGYTKLREGIYCN